MSALLLDFSLGLCLHVEGLKVAWEILQCFELHCLITLITWSGSEVVTDRFKDNYVQTSVSYICVGALQSKHWYFLAYAAVLVCRGFSVMMRRCQTCCIMFESSVSSFAASHKPLKDDGTRSVFGRKRSQSHKRLSFTACKLIPTFVILTVSFSRFVEPQRKLDVKTHPSELAGAENRARHTSDLQRFCGQTVKTQCADWRGQASKPVAPRPSLWP